MDNPQHYQPLSAALRPPSGPYATYAPSKRVSEPHDDEEDEDEDEEGEDEGMVEEQLHESENAEQPGSEQSSPRIQTTSSSTIAPTTTSHAPTNPPRSSEAQDDSQRKRRPGRPRGSKNRRPRILPPGKQEPQSGGFYSYSVPTQHTTAPAPPAHPDVNSQNQQYYEFQWRVLNLCAEFYGAAEELVKATPPLVISQCYHMGPSSKVDPLTMVSEAKRICDSLLANPSHLISKPPPPLYSGIPTFIPHQPQPPPTIASTSTTSTPTVITNPQSFIVSLGAPPNAYQQYTGVYPPQGGPQYPTTPYYQYSPYAPPGTGYYPPPQPTQPTQPTQAPVTQPAVSAPTSAPALSTSSAPMPASAPGINQGTWSEEELERLKKLAEESKNIGSSQEIEWDWVVHQWGNSRTRHQILIKATSLGLKESSGRGIKRRRENDGEHGDTESPTTAVQTPINGSTSTPASAGGVAPAESPSVSVSTTASPLQQHPAPHQQHQQHQQNQHQQQHQHQQPAPPPVTTAASMPWPMPTVAVNTPSPVLNAASNPGVASSTQATEPQRTSYYRQRPDQSGRGGGGTSKGLSATPHPYMYQPNGSLRKENGK